jgi:hypothetical protein
VHRRPERAARTGDLPQVVLVTASWGDSEDERRYAVRTLAGGLSRRARVSVVHVTPNMEDGPIRVKDGAFDVHRVRAEGPRTLRQALVTTALGGADPARPLPAVAGRGLLELEGGWSEQVAEVVESLRPDVVLLGGIQQAWPAPTLAALGGGRTIRRVVAPLAGDDAKLELPGYRDLLRVADAVLTIGAGERRRVESATRRAVGRGPEVVALPVPLRVNPAARRQRLVGLTSFDGYILVVRGFPEGSLERREAPDYARIRQLLEGTGIAEVSQAAWRVSRGPQDHQVVPVGHSRVNLWRLVSHALVTVDLRPAGLFGREAIESLLLGTPVVVLASSPAREVVEQSGGGLVVDAEVDLPEAIARVAEPALRKQLSEAGEAWAAERHGDLQRLADEAVAAVLGPLAGG